MRKIRLLYFFIFILVVSVNIFWVYNSENEMTFSNSYNSDINLNTVNYNEKINLPIYTPSTFELNLVFLENNQLAILSPYEGYLLDTENYSYKKQNTEELTTQILNHFSTNPKIQTNTNLYLPKRLKGKIYYDNTNNSVVVKNINNNNLFFIHNLYDVFKLEYISPDAIEINYRYGGNLYNYGDKSVVMDLSTFKRRNFYSKEFVGYTPRDNSLYAIVDNSLKKSNNFYSTPSISVIDNIRWGKYINDEDSFILTNSNAIAHYQNDRIVRNILDTPEIPINHLYWNKNRTMNIIFWDVNIKKYNLVSYSFTNNNVNYIDNGLAIMHLDKLDKLLVATDKDLFLVSENGSKKTLFSNLNFYSQYDMDNFVKDNAGDFPIVFSNYDKHQGKSIAYIIKDENSSAVEMGENINVYNMEIKDGKAFYLKYMGKDQNYKSKLMINDLNGKEVELGYSLSYKNYFADESLRKVFTVDYDSNKYRYELRMFKAD